jgi:hypothetical protein
VGRLGPDGPELRRDQGEGDGLKRLALLPLLFLACSTTETSSPTTTPDAGSPAPEDAGASSTCVVAAPPAALGLEPFFTKHLAIGSFSVVSSANVPDDALCVARDVVTKMTEERPELLERLAEKKINLAIIGKDEKTRDIPDYADLDPSYDTRARGLGATLARPTVSGAEENVLCHANDVYKGESILVHEFSHAIFDIAIELYEPAMKTRLVAAYDAALAAGKYADTYAATTVQEYWAEGVQDWFDTNITVPPGSPPDGIHNEIGTRDQLKTYDPDLAQLVSEVFGDRSWRYACPSK